MPALRYPALRAIRTAASQSSPRILSGRFAGRGHFHDFLVAPLHGAIAFLKMQQVAVFDRPESALRCGGRAAEISPGKRRHRRSADGFPLRFLQACVEIAASRTTRMPRPPPPIAAFTITGTRFRWRFCALPRAIVPASPCPAARECRPRRPSARAAVLSPSSSSSSGVGADECHAGLSHARANAGFSERNP